MDNETLKRLISIPPNAKGAVSDIADLDAQDIPWDRAPEFKSVMRTSTNEYDKVWAARELANWGDDDGYDFLESYVCDRPSSNEVLMAHRLRGYDDTNTQILDAAAKYWARKADAGSEGEARKRIFKLTSRIIALSNTMQFEIYKVPFLVEQGMTEYLPLLKDHLTAIIKNPEFHYWKVADCAHFLMQLNSEFVTKTLAEHGKTLADFPNK